jgi:phospholipase/carboxylesterase
MHETTTTLATLTCRVVQQEPTPPELIVVLCHGFGAPGDDLVALGAELLHGRPSLGPHVRFVFPSAPLPLANLGMGPGRAWWMIDMQRLMALQMGTQRPDEATEHLAREVPEGLSNARKLLMGLLSELTVQTKLPMSRIVLGGFSQGAMLATDVTLRLEEAPAALCLMSGALINRADWEKRAPTRQGLKVLQAHGRQDPLLPFSTGTALRDLLTQSGMTVDFIPFNGGHTITLETLSRMGALIESLLPPR